MAEAYIIPDDTNDIGVVTSGNKAKLIVIGPNKQDVFDDAVACAENMPEKRKVVWIKDRTKATAWTDGDDTVEVVALSYSNKIAEKIRQGQLQDVLSLEAAFLKAQNFDDA